MLLNFGLGVVQFISSKVLAGHLGSDWNWLQTRTKILNLPFLHKNLNPPILKYWKVIPKFNYNFIAKVNHTFSPNHSIYYYHYYYFHFYSKEYIFYHY